MVSQKLISFKVDQSQLERMDLILPQIGLNRNKFINACVVFLLDCIELQISVAIRDKKPLCLIPFMSKFN